MLGEKWKALSVEEKKVYEEQARLLAKEQKKINPDCWKRKKQVCCFKVLFKTCSDSDLSYNNLYLKS